MEDREALLRRGSQVSGPGAPVQKLQPVTAAASEVWPSLVTVRFLR